MTWQNLLDSGGLRVLPWLGGRQVHAPDRTWTIDGALPLEHGWYRFATRGGRKAVLDGEAQPDPDFDAGQRLLRGYVVGSRFVADSARVDPNPARLVAQTEAVHCVEPGLDRFARASVLRDRGGRLVFVRQEFPDGPETDVEAAFQDRRGSVGDIAGVTPALDLAFRWLSYQRQAAAAARAWRETARREAARAETLRRLARAVGGSAVSRRHLAGHDFEAAARAALAQANAELLDVRDGYERHEKIVVYRFRERRFECVVDPRTLGVLDSGVCLTDHDAGVSGDTWFTLESLPGVIGEAIDRDVLVVYRHGD